MADRPETKQDAETPDPGEAMQDLTKTPGDGTLKGSTPAGAGLEELKRRGAEEGSSEPGTG